MPTRRLKILFSFLFLVCAPFSLSAVAAQTKPVSTFASNPVERAQNYESHLARRKSSGIDNYYRQILEEKNPWNEFGRRFTYKQMDEYDLVDILTYYWMHSYGVSTNLMPDGFNDRNYDFKWNRGTWDAVRDQVRTMLNNAKSLDGLSNSAKQQVADTIMFETVFQQQALMKSRDNGKDDSGLRQSFNVLNAQLIGFDISKAALGSGGFYAPAGTNLKLPFITETTSTSSVQRGSSKQISAEPVDKNLPKVSGIYYASEWRQLIGAAPELNSSYTEETVTMLFVGGLACENCQTNWAQGASSFNAFRTKNPDKMGRWNASAAGTVVTMNGARTSYKRAEQFEAGRSGQKLDATVTTVSGPDGSGDHWNVKSYLKFHPDGRFSMIDDPAQVQTLAQYTGRYLVTGDFRIRLEYDDGTAETHGFAISPDDTSFFVIDGTAFYVSKNAK